MGIKEKARMGYFKRNWVYIIGVSIMVFCMTVVFNSKTHSFFEAQHTGTLIAKDKTVASSGKYSFDTAYMFAFELDDGTHLTQEYSLYEYTKFKVGDKFDIKLRVNQGWVFVAMLGVMFSFLGMAGYSMSRSDNGY